MKLLNVSFEIENDLQEYNLRNTLEAMGGKYLKTLPCTDHLKDDKKFKALKKSAKLAKNNQHDYVNRNRVNE